MKLLIPPVLFALCLTAMALLRHYYPAILLVPKPYHLLGLLPIALGLLSSFLGIRQFLKAKTNIHPFHEADTLVTSGPYRYTRNPMYMGLLLCLLGSWLLLRALTPLLPVLLFVLLADRWYIASEERMLRQKFGQAFEDYCSQTRRWI